MMPETEILEDVEEQELKQCIPNDAHKVPTVVGIFFVCLLFGLYGAIYLIDGILPTALRIADEIKNPKAFIAERAQQDLKVLTDIGPRVVGSYENEVLAVEFLKRKLEIIQQQAHDHQKMEIDVQIVTVFKETEGGMSIYSNVQNIVVKLHSKNNSTHSLLINSHFDSAPTSPGGSDDGINCAVMLEVLRKLSRSPKNVQHNIIFLFNGAEETGLQGSRGFITHHKWAKEVKAVVNLEASGAGGRIMLFQTGPEQPWLLYYYQKVPYPNAQVASEEIYESGLAAADTDFTIFKKFGIVGLDFAFIKNGYRYHTKFDGFSNIPGGSFQHVGANILSLARNLANASELSNPEVESKSRIVFYDFLGLFMICYTEMVAIIVHAIISGLSLGFTIKMFYDFGIKFSCNSLMYLFMTFIAILLGWVAAGLFVTVIAVIINALHFSLSWYNNPWIILGLYVTPVFTCSCVFIALVNHFKLKKYKDQLSISAQGLVQAHLIRLIWTIILLIGTTFGLRSTYLVLMPIIFNTLTTAIIQMFSLQHSIRKWQLIYLLGTIIPNIFLMKQALTIATFMVPVFGRTWFYAEAELQVAILALVLTLLITSVYTPTITLIRKPFLLLAALSGLFLIFFILVFTPLGFPYNGNPESPAPLRVEVDYLSTKTIRHQTNSSDIIKSGFLIRCQDGDPRDAIRKYIVHYLHERNPSEVVNATTDHVYWIPAEEPIIDDEERISLKLNSKTSITDSKTRFNFTVAGASKICITILPLDKITLTAVSVQSPLSYTTALNVTSHYLIEHVWCKRKIPLAFSLDFETPVNWTKPILNITLSGKYNYVIDKPNKKMQHYSDFLNEFPNWVSLNPRIEILEYWSF